MIKRHLLTFAVRPRPEAGSQPVVFDLGGVLLDWNPRHLYRRLFSSDTAGMERFLAEVCNPAWNAKQDAGRSWDEAIREATAAHPEDADLIRDSKWEECWVSRSPIRSPCWMN